MTQDYTGILVLCGRVFAQRGFVERFDAGEFIDDLMDLPEDQARTFAACAGNERLRGIVDLWWKIYDEEREAGAIPEVAAPWLNGE